MSFGASTPIQGRLYGDSSADFGYQPYQVLEVRLRFFHRLMTGSPSAGVPYQILHEFAPILLENVVFPLPLHQLSDPAFFQIYVVQLLSSLSIPAAACEGITRQIASYVFQMWGGDRETNFQIVANINHIQTTWMELIYGGSNDGGVVEETVVLEEAPPARRGAMERAMELKLEENGEEELGDCSICLEEMECKRRDVIKIPCGHVYHEPCIGKWLHSNNSCPLCRTPLPLDHTH